MEEFRLNYVSGFFNGSAFDSRLENVTGYFYPTDIVVGFLD